jgi:SepF-like predicted cell division protein (DUF552 family)
MKDKLIKLKDMFTGTSGTEDYSTDDFEDEYLEIDLNKISKSKSKIVVKPYIINEFEDIKNTLDDLREGYTITLINIKPLKDKDIVELKRAVNKLKKTCDAIDGDIAGFSEDWIVATPAFAHIHRSTQVEGLE